MLTNISNTSVLAGYTGQQAIVFRGEAEDSGSSAGKSEKDRVSISREAQALQTSYDEKKDRLEETYFNESEQLEREYLLEKRALEREMEQKKQSLGINVIA